MPYTTTWTEDGGIIWNYSGLLTGAEVIRSNMEIYGDERFDSLRYQIVDLREVTANEISKADMRKIGHLDMAAARSNPRVRVAVVTEDPVGAEISQFYAEITRGSPWKMAIFRKMDDALAWAKGDGDDGQ